MGKFSFLRVLELPKLLGDSVAAAIGDQIEYWGREKVVGEGSETREKSGPNGSSGELKFPKAT